VLKIFFKNAFASFFDSAEVSICCCSYAFGVEVICQNSRVGTLSELRTL
jgi:hypothetical protein